MKVNRFSLQSITVGLSSWLDLSFRNPVDSPEPSGERRKALLGLYVFNTTHHGTFVLKGKLYFFSHNVKYGVKSKSHVLGKQLKMQKKIKFSKNCIDMGVEKSVITSLTETQFHLYVAIVYFVCKTFLFFLYLIFCCMYLFWFAKANNFFFSILSFAIFKLLCEYMWHLFDYIVNI